jgi:hypothetical protein
VFPVSENPFDNYFVVERTKRKKEKKEKRKTTRWVNLEQKMAFGIRFFLFSLCSYSGLGIGYFDLSLYSYSGLGIG